MFDWLIPLLIVVILLLKILDYLDMLEVVGSVLRLIVAAAVGTVKLAVRLIRHFAGSSMPRSSLPRGSGCFNPRSPPPGRGHQEDRS